MSKYALQSLLLLSKCDEAFTESQIIRLMQENPASKKESPLGTPASMTAIVEWLVHSGCLEPIGRSARGASSYVISSRGRSLISLMHKDCFDPDLAARIEVWGKTWPESQPAIERYIRHFFGKQKRFLEAQVIQKGY